MTRETVVLRDAAERRARTTVGAVRLMAIVVSSLLAGVSARPLPTLLWLLATVVAGAVAWSLKRAGWTWRVAMAGEIALVAFAVPLTGAAASPLLPYLLGPLFSIGFRSGADRVGVAGAFLAAGLLAGLRMDAVRIDARAYLVSAAEWTVLAVAFGLVGAWARALSAGDDPSTRYVEVSRLLGELRGVARRLPGSLDPVSAAETLLDECGEATSYDRAGVFLGTGGERLTPLTVRGADRLDLDNRRDGTGHLAQAYGQGVVVRESGRDVRSGMASLLVVPIPGETTCSGVVVLESAEPAAFTDNVVQQVGRLVAATAPRLESAVLFDEIRRIATVEERQRVAREIHDGIAQELVYIGYELDALRADVASTPRAAEIVKRVREHVTKVVGELRLSIFTLRSAPDPGGLGAALSEYVRSVASSAGIAVHLSLSEDPARLPADAESELLRIAQEAVSNARKHAKAHNLWVTLDVDPPRALLRVEDDGEGIEGQRRRGFGLEIMQERAERLGATLRVTAREPKGTSVEVEVGT